jgi:tetratricopeptide (TPR) repeat protein
MPDTEVENIKTELARDISQYVPTGLLKDYLLLITEGNPADRAHPAFVAYSKELWDNGLGGELDLGVLLNHYTQTGDGKSQIKYLRMAVSRWPENPQWQNNLGYLLLSDSANWDEAEALISAALKLEPESLHFQDSMAWLHYLRGDYDLAAKYLPALEGSPEESSELLYHIGMIHLKLKNITKAEDFLTRALKAANPEDYADLARKQLELINKEP